MSVVGLLSQAAYLADDTDVGDETHKAGPLAILVIAVLCIACFLLFRSMSKHLRRVRDELRRARAGRPTRDWPSGHRSSSTHSGQRGAREMQTARPW